MRVPVDSMVALIDTLRWRCTVLLVVISKLPSHAKLASGHKSQLQGPVMESMKLTTNGKGGRGVFSHHIGGRVRCGVSESSGRRNLTRRGSGPEGTDDDKPRSQPEKARFAMQTRTGVKSATISCKSR